MRKSTHSEEYRCVLNCLVAMRKKAGLTQRDLARRLKREPSFVWRIENGERRLDMVEFHWVCEALGEHAGPVYLRLLTEFGDAARTHYPGPAPMGKAADGKPQLLK